MKTTKLLLVVIMLTSGIILFADLNDGLIAHYPFNGNANDESGNGNSGIVNGATLATDRFGNENCAYQFDAYLETIELPNQILDNAMDITTSFWLKSDPSQDVGILTGANSSNSNEYFFRLIGGIIQTHINGDYFDGTITVNNNVWHNIIITRDATIGTVKLFVDGVLDSEVNLPPGSISISEGGLWLGNDQDALGGNWNYYQQFLGKLDDFRFYDRVLTESEVQDVFSLGNLCFANFFTDETNIIRDSQVQFTDTSSGIITTWEWDFNNDGIIDSYLQNPSYTYTQNGIYSVTQIVNDGTNTDVKTKVDYILVTDATQSAWSLQFDGTDDYVIIDHDDSQNIATYTLSAWIKLASLNREGGIIAKGTFNDGDGTTNPPYHFYVGDDNCLHLDYEDINWDDYYYTSTNSVLSIDQWHFVSVTRDENNDVINFYVDGILKDTFTNTIDPATINQPAFIGIAPYGGGVFPNNNGATKYFDGVIDDVRIWNIARSATEIQTDMHNELTGSEQYLVAYYQMYERIGQIVHDLSTNGTNGYLGSTVNPDNNDPIWVISDRIVLDADFSASTYSGILPLEIQFSDLSTGNPTNWEWDFNNDGTIDSNYQNPVFTFTEPDTYSVSLTVSNGAGSSTETKEEYIFVAVPVEADFSASSLSGIHPLEIQFSDLSTGNTTNWEWDFDNDGTIDSNEQNPIFTYTEVGIYSVSLTTGTNLSSDTEIKIDYITVVLPIEADFEASPLSGIYPLEVQFTDLSFGGLSSNLRISGNRRDSTSRESISWEWDFNNDGTIDSYDQNPTFTYTNAGNYSVSLSVSDGINSDSEIKNNYIEVHNLIVANFIVDNQSVSTGVEVQFTDLSTGSPISWEWDFNNDGFIDSNEQNPTHIYNNPGIFDVKMNAINNFSENEIIRSEYITVVWGTPEEPENVQVVIEDGNTIISWDEVTQSTDNVPLDIDFYVINYSDDPSADPDEYLHLALTPDLTHTHTGVVWFADQMFYQVIAIRDYEEQYGRGILTGNQEDRKLSWREYKDLIGIK